MTEQERHLQKVRDHGSELKSRFEEYMEKMEEHMKKFILVPTSMRFVKTSNLLSEKLMRNLKVLKVV